VPERFTAAQGAATKEIIRAAMAAALVLAPVGLFWYQDYGDFRAVCQLHGTPKITRTGRADGFYLDDPTANSFGMRYLQEEGFKWMEARSIHQRGEFVRYEITTERKITETAQKHVTARFSVSNEFNKPNTHTSATFTRVIDTEAPAGAQELARCAIIHFSGGRMSAVLGAYGTATCPSARSDSGTWSNAYHLVRNTLGPGQ
jgi:hypothetical protein